MACVLWVFESWHIYQRIGGEGKLERRVPLVVTWLDDDQLDKWMDGWIVVVVGVAAVVVVVVV